ncbi:MAG: hypothetical protein V7K32_14235 [Nostoc sp.]
MNPGQRLVNEVQILLWEAIKKRSLHLNKVLSYLLSPAPNTQGKFCKLC